MASTMELLLYGAIRKDCGNGHRFFSALKDAGYGWYGEELPYGCIVCTCELVSIFRTETIYMPFEAQERWFGDYSPGRWAWRLENVRIVDNIPARGSQGFWEWAAVAEPVK